MLNVKRVSMSRVQFDELERLQVKKRLDWPAIFSTNPAGKIWPPESQGLTKEVQRLYFCDPPKFLKGIAAELLHIRGGGRFFINDEGAFYKDDYGEPVPFIRFEITG